MGGDGANMLAPYDRAGKGALTPWGIQRHHCEEKRIWTQLSIGCHQPLSRLSHTGLTLIQLIAKLRNEAHAEGRAARNEARVARGGGGDLVGGGGGGGAVAGGGAVGGGGGEEVCGDLVVVGGE